MTDIDEQLNELAQQPLTAPPHLKAQILSNLAPQNPSPLDELFAWFAQALWRPALAFVLPLILGFGIGFSGEPQGMYQPETLLFSEVTEEVFDDEF